MLVKSVLCTIIVVSSGYNKYLFGSESGAIHFVVHMGLKIIVK